MNISDAYGMMFQSALIVIGVCLIFTVVKSIIGPRISDRFMTGNMIGTLVTSCIVILSAFLSGETYLIDVAIIYVLISFLAVVIFTMVYINEYLKKKKNRGER